jgi:hypothetical protein
MLLTNPPGLGSVLELLTPCYVGKELEGVDDSVKEPKRCIEVLRFHVESSEEHFALHLHGQWLIGPSEIDNLLVAGLVGHTVHEVRCQVGLGDGVASRNFPVPEHHVRCPRFANFQLP